MGNESSITISVQQIASTVDPETNLAIALEAIRRGAAAGARIVVLPEATHVRFGTDATPYAESVDGPWASGIKDEAARLGVIVLVGMFQPSGDGRILNTILVSGAGVDSQYNKIHLYDAYGFRESDSVKPGNDPLVFEVDGHKFGVATCYDIRFPELFRAYADMGAIGVLVPTHWGSGEGKLDAWELMSRARALDSTLWVITCDQSDPAESGVSVPPGPGFGIGHSMAIDPLGRIVDELGSGPGEFQIAIDHSSVDEARKTMPVLASRRFYVSEGPETM